MGIVISYVSYIKLRPNSAYVLYFFELGLGTYDFYVELIGTHIPNNGFINAILLFINMIK